MPRVYRLIALLNALALLFVLPETSGAYCRTTTIDQTNPQICTDGTPIAWPGSCISLSVNPTLLPTDLTRDDFRAVVTTAGSLWSAVDCGGGSNPSFHFVEYPDYVGEAEWLPNGRNANLVLFRGTWSDNAHHPAGAIAVTTVTFGVSSGTIFDADTELNLQGDGNPDGFQFTHTDLPGPNQVDLQSVLTHELGHTQGLAHSAIFNSVMWFSAGLGERRRVLTPDDIAGICAIYPSTRVANCQPEPLGGFVGSGCHCGVPVSRDTRFRPRIWLMLVGVMIALRFRRNARV